MAIDFEKEVASIVAMVPSEYTLAPETPIIVIESLEDVDRKYGPDSSRPLSYHNAPHSVGVTRRCVRMGNILMPYIRPDYRQHFYDLAIIDAATHDNDQDSGPGTNEENSILYALQKIEEKDGVLNTPSFKERVPLGIQATKVDRLEDGEIVQADLQSGSHDPIKFGMAFGDINGIAMEGSKRMWQDATNLYYEITENPSIEGLYSFLVNQAFFLRKRLNDGRVKADIAYYFPDAIEAVYADMRTAFHTNIISAYRLTTLLGEHPELKIPIGVAAKTIDQSRIGGVVGQVLTRKLAAVQ
ncbi:MAG: hypothetical protein WA843_02575 [Candidatus Saccharimonadales bacterium]